MKQTIIKIFILPRSSEMTASNVMDSAAAFSWLPRESTFYEDRLETFRDWPKQIVPDKYALAKAGFRYTGQHDKVECFVCELKLTGWERIDDPWTEHKRWSPHCVYLQLTGCGESEQKNNNPTIGKTPVSTGFDTHSNSFFNRPHQY